MEGEIQPPFCCLLQAMWAGSLFRRSLGPLRPPVYVEDGTVRRSALSQVPEEVFFTLQIPEPQGTGPSAHCAVRTDLDFQHFSEDSPVGTAIAHL